MSENNGTRNFWKEEEENLLRQWADKAQCYQWMHSRGYNVYSRKNALFTIPVIIISTVTGTANFAQDRFPEDLKQYIVMGIGTLSIVAGIITTIYQFLQISELNEGHRVAAMSWGKFHNTLKTLVLRHPLDRMPPNEAIKLYHDEYDRLTEISPQILRKVLISFNSKFKKNNTLTKPEICNKLDATQIYNMSSQERDIMINKINHKPTNKKLQNTFFNINGRRPSDNEMIEMADATNLSDSDSSSSQEISNIVQL